MISIIQIIKMMLARPKQVAKVINS